jgi:hypothetical protein
MPVFSTRIGRMSKEKMEKYSGSGRVNQVEEIEKIIVEKIREFEAEENFKKILRKLEKAEWSVPKGFSVKSVREDRDDD